MEGYLLYRKEGRTALVLIHEDDDELYYVLRKLYRSRDKVLKNFAADLLEEYFKETNKKSGET